MEPFRLESEEVRRYERDVLHLHDTHNEHDLDEQHQSDATALGVDVSHPRPLAPSCVSSSTVSTAARRSESADSHRSASTGLTSNFSRNSKDLQRSPISPSFPNAATTIRPKREQKPASPSLPSTSLTALPLTPASPASPTSPSRSAFRPLSPSFQSPIGFNKGFSVRRGFGRISRLKRSSTSSRGSTTDTNKSLQPSPIFQNTPRSCSFCHEPVLESAAAGPHLQRQDSSIFRGGQKLRLSFSKPAQPEAMVLRPKTSSLPENRGHTSLDGSQMPQPVAPRGRAASQGDDPAPTPGLSSVAELEDAHRNLDHAMEFPDFRSLRTSQENERDRFLDYHSTQKRKLADAHQSRNEDLQKKHAETRQSLCATHSPELTSLEDRHVREEMELLESQEVEMRNCEIALKHMQAYCRTSSDPACETPNREVTLQDRRNLERQYWLRNNLPRRHESAVNVMREQQARQLKHRSLKHMSQLSDQQSEQEKELKSLDQSLANELKELDGLVLQRKERLVKRWVLAVEIWKHCREQDEKTIINLPLTAITWPEAKDEKSRI
ncbi:MAG: hypothetical protein M1828_002530 [Chrysothrix sp. TS-e1954]|nr:MAG: hypothetical protein M1828_002530 [Chrysothrix sp. TS-e1954]